jgi:4'-phosphopantetheinyl transferase
MVRTVLSKYADVAPRDWRFAANEYGKPSIAAEHTKAKGVEFNLSHTEGLIVLGVTRGRALGVDVENTVPREVDLEVADRFFARTEVAALHMLPGHQQEQRFFEYWTLKEAYIKARGMGLSIPLNSFAFCLQDPARIRVKVEPESSSPGRWLFWQLRLSPDHLSALCAEDGDAQRPSLRAASCWP